MFPFVILRHDSPRSLHWDLMLEAGETLRTWALQQPPDAGGWIEAELLADHRRAYLDYEGPVSGGRGSVTRFDRGEYAIESQTADRWTIRLAGQRLRGQAVIEKTAQAESRWRFQFQPAGPTSD